MTTDEPSSSIGQWIVSTFRILLRLLFVVVLAIGLGAGIYFGAANGIPALRQRYIQPVEDNTFRLDNLEAQLTQDAQALEERVDGLGSRLAELEIQMDNDKATIRDLRARLATGEALLATQERALSTVMPLATMTGIQANLDSLNAELENLSTAIEDYQQEIKRLQSNDAERNESIIRLLNEIQLLRAMEFLTRSRLFLSQGNLGQAEIALQNGLVTISVLEDDLPDYQKEEVIEVRAFLERALRMLPDSPVNAVDQIEGAWRLLADGLPLKPTPTTVLTDTQAQTPTPAPSLTSTPND